MPTNERKEIIQLSGPVILSIMALIANILIVGFAYRYHNFQVVAEGKAHNQRMKVLYANEHDIKQEIINIEGVKTWNDTSYMRQLGR